MEDFNSLIEIIKTAQPLVQTLVTPLVGAFIAAMFLRGNTQRAEFEKIKVGKINEAVEDLVTSRELTLTELVKCKNLLKIAKIADKENKRKNYKNNHEAFDFDWFLRFFESAGNISAENMQLLWAKVLNGEIANHGSFSFRALEILRNMNSEEARIFEYCYKFHIISPHGDVFLLSSDDSFSNDHENNCITNDSDWFEILDFAYKITHEKIALLEECGILSSILITDISYISKEPVIFSTYTHIIKLQSNKVDNYPFELKGFRFTKAAIELFSIMENINMLKYTLDIGRLIKYFHKELSVGVFEFFENDENDEFYYDTDNDLLINPKYKDFTMIRNFYD